jgi:hypothetical protein
MKKLAVILAAAVLAGSPAFASHEVTKMPARAANDVALDVALGMCEQGFLIEVTKVGQTEVTRWELRLMSEKLLAVSGAEGVYVQLPAGKVAHFDSFEEAAALLPPCKAAEALMIEEGSI